MISAAAWLLIGCLFGWAFCEAYGLARGRPEEARLRRQVATLELDIEELEGELEQALAALPTAQPRDARGRWVASHAKVCPLAER